MFVAVNKKNIITAVSETQFLITGQNVLEIQDSQTPQSEWHKLIGTRLPGKEKTTDNLKVAIICNWNDTCGISTYSRYLVDELIPKVREIRIFSEIVPNSTSEDEYYVIRCWERGKSMKSAIDQLLAWEPDFVIVQHEFGIFPKATYFLQMLHLLDETPYIVVMHSVYEHLDKAVCHAAVKNIVVHSEEAKNILRKTGNNSNIYVIPHGCVKFKQEDTTELWNIFQTPYPLVQFGFGFFYKGVDKILDAIHHLKQSDQKFKDIFYCYLCSDNPHTNLVHAQYQEFLQDKIKKLELEDNAVIVRKYQTAATINNYLRTAKIAVFPYISDPKNTVYGASGAIRIAMANGIPVIASDCHMFDDLDGVIPRPKDYLSLAKEIDEIFSNDSYRRDSLLKINKHIDENTWSISADRYLNLYKELTG